MANSRDRGRLGIIWLVAASATIVAGCGSGNASSPGEAGSVPREDQPAAEITSDGATSAEVGDTEPIGTSSDLFASAVPVTFDFKDDEGWSWRGAVDSLPSIQATVTTVDSPPGMAKLQLDLVGEASFADFISLDEGRNPPNGGVIPGARLGRVELDFEVSKADNSRYLITANEPPDGFEDAPCTLYGGPGYPDDQESNYSYGCAADSFDTGSLTSNDIPEETANWLADQVFTDSNLTVAHIRVREGFVGTSCEFGVNPAGEIPYQSDCTAVTGQN